ncbi:hypothetical protein E3N88_28374 [Mikania micrantha]|uniref:PGG domain-containing protein n=1 Tax=Mikania micrantha TaxID=192012 RepID=A0A5N6MZA4_9ASTR|nr:hypothetical protein E3N88_28374 [Mikania micrantha]
MPDVKHWFEAFFEGDMAEIYYLLGEGDVDAIKNNINSDGNSILHIAVAIRRKDLIKKILSDIDAGDLVEIKNKKGSTVLHIAAIVGNTRAAEVLVKKNKELLHIKDDQGKTPLIKAYENMRLDTALSLLNASSSKDDESSENAEQISKSYISDEDFHTGIRVLVQAILAKKYDIAEKIINQKADYAVSNDEVLLALASTFPSGIDNVETFFWPLPAIKNIELKKKEYEDAKKVLQLVCRKIKGKHHADNSNRSSSSRRELTELYTRPILEAACQDAYDVVDEILEKWPEAILCKDKKGCNIIQLATMHRSLKIYNLIYTFREHSNDDYGTMEDSSENNMLHLAGRLAPSNRLKRHTGAALQLQSELQWHQRTSLGKHRKWIKAVAESCSITAALITTIVFAAAITVPGGSSQNGVPVFTNETAFLVFAFSDAISLFSSVTALLVFLSILTSRFAEQDFLVRLPRQLIIGLCTLLVSTSAMIVAFGATLFLVFCRRKLWMIAPICGLAFVPIAIFFILKLPLILDLFRSTYRSRFGKNNHHNSKFNASDLKFFFGK